MKFNKGNLSIEDVMDIFETLHRGFTIASPDGRYLYMNHSMEELFDIKFEKVKGMTSEELEREGILSPCLTPIVLKKKKKVFCIQRNRKGEKYFVTGLPIFDKAGSIKYIIAYSSWEMEDFQELQGRYNLLKNDNERLSRELREIKSTEINEDNQIINTSVSKKMCRIIQKAAIENVPLFIYGEKGTGKEYWIRQLQGKYAEGKKPLLKLNRNLMEYDPEKELYGGEQGPGLLEVIGDGILVIECPEMLALNVQERLAYDLKKGCYTNYAGECMKLKAKIVAVSETAPENLVKLGKISKNLFYELTLIVAKTEPLSNNPEDLEKTVDYFMQKLNLKHNRNIRFSNRAKNALFAYGWPGNIDELKYVLEKIIIMSETDYVDIYDLPVTIQNDIFYKKNDAMDLKEMLEFYERNIITRVYSQYKTTVGVAKKLNISQPSAARKIAKYMPQGKEYSKMNKRKNKKGKSR